MQAKWIPRPNFNVEEEGKTRNEGKMDTKADAEDGIRDQPRSRGLGDVYKRQYNSLVLGLPISNL